MAAFPRSSNMRPKESLLETSWRLRGLLGLLTVPLALVGLVAVFMPRSGPASLPLAASGGAAGGVYEGPHKFAVVIDAGSTGSRVSVFEFERSGNDLELVHNVYKALKPGLSSYAGRAGEGADSLQPLLDEAVAAVPPELHAVTPITVRATAGLRLLPGAQAEELLAGAARPQLSGAAAAAGKSPVAASHTGPAAPAAAPPARALLPTA